MRPSIIEAVTISDAWYQAIYNLIKGDRDKYPRAVYKISKGSYVGQKRLEFEFFFCTIKHPLAEPMLPEFPEALKIPVPVDEGMDYIASYFAKYLMGTVLEDKETYIYGTWLAPGIERVIDQLKGSPGNNQATISLGGWAPTGKIYYGPKDYTKLPTEQRDHLDEGGELISRQSFDTEMVSIPLFQDTDNFFDPGTGQRDPACLRQVDFRYTEDGKLHMFVYFRSWDLWGGFPANLAGLALVQRHVASQIGAEVGMLTAASKGLHLYDHCIDVACQRLGDDHSSMDDFLEFAKKRIDNE